MTKNKNKKTINLSNVDINKIQEFEGFKHVELGGFNLKADKCIIYDNCGIGIYYKGERLTFIECKNFEVINFGKYHTTIKYNCHLGQFSASYIYLRYKEIGEDEDIEEEKETNFIKDDFKVGSKVIRRYNEDHSSKHNPNEKYSDANLISNVCFHDKELILTHINEIRTDFEWELVEIIDGIMGRIKKSNIEELCLLKDIETLDTIIHNTEQLIISLELRRNTKSST